MGIYHRPVKLKDALVVLSETGAMPVAGCTDVFAATEAQELAGDVLDVTALEGLRGVSETEAGWRIGAATRWSDIIQARLPHAFDMLKEAAREVGGAQVQNAGTLGGNICNASPAADGMPPLLALDAVVELVSQKGTRKVSLGDFVVGPRHIDRRADELVSALIVPRDSAKGTSRFLKLGARKHLVISIAMVAVRFAHTNGVISDAAVAIGACGPVARRVMRLEDVLVGVPVRNVAGAVLAEHFDGFLDPISDVRGTAEYRGTAVVELVRRAAQDAVGSMP